MNLRDFLEQHEKELTAQLAERKRLMIPFEAELAEIRHAKKALNPEAPGASALSEMNDLRRFLDDREIELRTTADQIGSGLHEIVNELAEVRKVQASIGLRPTKEFAVGDSVEISLAEWESVPEAVGIPYQSTTIKELILLALRNHFPNGATIKQMIQFLMENWGRNIDRASLSPQLSRLFAAGQITQFGNRKEWFLLPARPTNPEYHPYQKADGEIVWMIPNQAREGDVPGKIRETSRPDFET